MVMAAENRGKADDPIIRQQLAQAYLDLQVFKMTSTRAQSKVGKGEMPGPEGSILKLFWSNLNQHMVQIAQNILGPYGQMTEGPFEPFSYNYLRCRGNSIEAGTDER
jgi:alkylation response protein AidB-like acyl-CoA dehydrogenase